MINFLENLGISREIIDELNQKEDQSNLYNLSCNEYEIEKIINYFEEIGITCIEEILLRHVGLFFETESDIKKRFSKYNVKKVVEIINKHPDSIVLVN